ncbi:apical junction molecule-like [Schistocerca nitens]|uniref:apical junction molecule-like n=1 Tax=Schistocerca nitens TaxID=7011 RepID=UPI002117A6DA|nr:apical junction molecule-like [Schistocerca nitens]
MTQTLKIGSVTAVQALLKGVGSCALVDQAVLAEIHCWFDELLICELRFNAVDIENITSAYDPKTGKLLTAHLDRPRLKKDAVPSKLPGCPTYLSSKQAPAREEPESRRERLENQALEKVIEQSMESHTKMMEKISLASLEEFKLKLSDCERHRDWETSKVFGDVVVRPIDVDAALRRISDFQDIDNQELLNIVVDDNDVDEIEENTWPLLHYISAAGVPRPPAPPSPPPPPPPLLIAAVMTAAL